LLPAIWRRAGSPATHDEVTTSAVTLTKASWNKMFKNLLTATMDRHAFCRSHSLFSTMQLPDETNALSALLHSEIAVLQRKSHALVAFA
jgi:hypothetical protein